MSLLLLGPEGPTPLEAGDTPPVGVLAHGVVAHRVRLAATGARARAAEAEALAAELAATPPEATHVALGPVAPDGEAWLAIADPEAVEAATGVFPMLPARLAGLFDRPERMTRLPADARAVAAFIDGLPA
ncbi:MAG: hypothetical protein ACK4MT_05960 [Thermaurantiacus tibetensis]